MTRQRRRRFSACGPRAVALAVALVIAVLCLGVVIPRGGSMPGDANAPSRKILVLKGPIHTDIALPADPETRARFAFLGKSGLPIERPDVGWIIAGWGGRSFYTETPTWADLKPMPLIRTILGDASTVHLALAGEIHEQAPEVMVIELPDAAYKRLLASIMSSFAPDDPGGAPVDIAGANYGLYDRFFEARGTFHLLANCNSWTAAMLRDAGVTTGLWTPLPSLLFLSLDLYGPAS